MNEQNTNENKMLVVQSAGNLNYTNNTRQKQ